MWRFHVTDSEWLATPLWPAVGAAIAWVVGILLVMLPSTSSPRAEGPSPVRIVLGTQIVIAIAVVVACVVAFAQKMGLLDPRLLAIVAFEVGGFLAATGASWRSSLGSRKRVAVGIFVWGGSWVSVAHSAYLVTTHPPPVVVDGSRHQHVGVGQTLRARTVKGIETAFQWTSDRERIVRGDDPGRVTVAFTMAKPLLEYTKEFRVEVGRQDPAPWFDLRPGNVWVYEVHTRGKGGESTRNVELKILDRKQVDAVVAFEIAWGSKRTFVYPWEGHLYLEGGEPLFSGAQGAPLDPRSGPYRFPLFGSEVHCTAFGPVAEDVAVAGPTRCTGSVRSTGLGDLIAAVATGGVSTMVHGGGGVDVEIVLKSSASSTVFER